MDTETMSEHHDESNHQQQQQQMDISNDGGAEKTTEQVIDGVKQEEEKQSKSSKEPAEEDEDDFVEEDNEKRDSNYQQQEDDEFEEEDEELDKQMEEDERIAKELQQEDEHPPPRTRRQLRARNVEPVNYFDGSEGEQQDDDDDEESSVRIRSKYARTRGRRRNTIKRRNVSRSSRSSVEDEPQRKELRSRQNRVNYAEVDEEDVEFTESTNGDGEETVKEEQEEQEEEEEQSPVKDEEDDYVDQEEEGDDDDEDDEDYGRKPRKRKTVAKPRTRKRRTPRRRVKHEESSDEEMNDANSDDEEEQEDEEVIPTIDKMDDEDFAVELILAKKHFAEEEKIKYFIKFKDRSYIHCEWATKEEVNTYTSGPLKLKNFDKKFSLAEFEGEDEFFNPSYCEVDRVLDYGICEDKKMYFVKWKLLGYDQCTWEWETDIHDKSKINEFMIRKKPPSKMDRRPRPRPPASFFKKLEHSPKFKDGNELREYQLEGLNWLVYCWFNRRNSILADEMGLGKTVQTVSMLEWLRTEQHNRGPYLVVAPLSTINHWKREFENWTEMNVILLHGNQGSRNVLKDYEWHYVDAKGRIVPDVYKFNVIITTYEMVLSEKSTLNKIKWQYLVVDEGHRLKNKKSKLLEILRTFKTEHKLLLTGTPLQNDMEELWSLLNYIDGETFNSCTKFLRDFGDMQDSEDLSKLHKLIGPYLLRRLKEDVEKSIPPKEEIVVEVVPTNIQKQYYRAILDKNREFLKRGIEKAQNVPRLVNILMEIRKVCNHPYLIDGAEETITKHMHDENEINESLVKTSSKLLLVDKLLKKLREGGHKVLIFSQMVRVLNILEDYMQLRNYPYVRLDGTIRGDQRQTAIDRFSNPELDTFVFLVSTRAGGVGINLTAADTVIIYDSDWNPQNDLQAQARCHRIGQTKDVKIYRLLTKNTREKEMFEKASRKLGLDRAVLNGSRENSEIASKSGKGNNSGLEKEEIDMLLKYGAYSAIKDDTEDEKMLVEGDIDSILARNSTIVRYDTQSEEEEGKQTEKGLLTFSKATFCFNETGEDVDINAADFWDKMLPDRKDAEGLMRKLNERDSLKSEDEIDQFFVDLNVLVEENQKDIKHFKYDGCDALASLLTQVIYCIKLDRDRIELAKDWLEIVDKPRLRNQKRSENSSDEEEDDDNDGAYQEKKSKVASGGWLRAERARFQSAFLSFGWGKWEQIRSAAKLTHHDAPDVLSFAESFVYSMISKSSEANSKNILTEIMLSNAVEEEDHGIHDHDETDRKEAVNGESMDTTDDNGKPTLSKSEEEFKQEKLHINPDPEKTATVEPGSKVEISLPSPLTSAHLEVIYQRQGKPNLCIRFIPIPEDASGTFHITAPGFPGNFIIRVVGQNTSAQTPIPLCVKGIHPCLQDKEFEEQSERNLKTRIKKLHFTFNLHKVVGIDGEKTFKIPHLAIKPPTSWWNDECDAGLLLGFVKHGYGKVEQIKQDEDNLIHQVFHNTSKNTNNRRDKKKIELSFPTVAALNKRALKLIDTMMRDIVPSTPSKSKSSRGLIDVNDSWSKREKADLQKILLIRGTYPDEKTGEAQYTKISQLANLKKTNQQIEDMIEAILTRAQEIKDETEDDKKDKSKEPAKIELSPTTAQKLLSRVHLMHELTINVFPYLDHDFQSKLKYLSIQGNGLPKWWKSSDDMALVRGVRKHGFDFKQIFESYPDEKKIPREGLLSTRLSQIAKLGGKITKLGSPSSTKSVGQWVFTPKKGHVVLNSPTPDKKRKRSVNRQTSIRKFTLNGDEEDPIEDFDEKKPPRTIKNKKSSTSSSTTTNGPRVRKTKTPPKKPRTKASPSTKKTTPSKSSSSTKASPSTSKSKSTSSGSKEPAKPVRRGRQIKRPREDDKQQQTLESAIKKQKTS